MSTIVKTEGVVLKSMKYRESSKIVTLYTREFGKMSTIVKGARRAKNKYGSSLEPMSYDSVVVYKKEGRDLQTLAQCELIKSFRHLYDDLERMSAGLTIVELVNMIAHEEEGNVPLFALLVESLELLNAAQKNPSNLLYRFEIRLAAILGFRPTFDACISCQAPVESSQEFREDIPFHLSKGGPLCGRCTSRVPGSGNTFTLSRSILQVLNCIARNPMHEGVLEIPIDQQSRVQIEHFLWMYLCCHVSGMRSLKSSQVFTQILRVA